MVTKMLQQPLKAAQYKTDVHPEWCPGCGDFGIINAMQQAMAEMQMPPWETYFFSGVGCSGKSPHYVHVYGAHTLHGRVLPYALGAKIANPKLSVVAAGGDGDGYGIGAGHFVHAGRRNVDLTYIVFDNEVYGLTKGQASPTLAQGAQPKSLPAPNTQRAVNPFALALAAGYTFIARSYAYDAKHLKNTIQAAIRHKGMALIDVLQPCPTYNDIHTKEYYAEKVAEKGMEVPRVYYLEDTGYDGVVKNPADAAEVAEKRSKAFQKIYEIEDREPLGVYWKIDLPTYDELLKGNLPLLREYDPIDLPYYDEKSLKATTNLTPGFEHLVV